MKLFHFSEEAGIEEFVPRAVEAVRSPEREWLNEPLVWAIDDWHQPMYLFPRDCPRILVWPVATTSASDRERWFGTSGSRMIAHVEEGWLERIGSTRLYRYEFLPDSFVCLDDAGMWVSRCSVTPSAVEALDDLPGTLREAGVELRAMPSLAPLRDAWATTLHVSGIRLRNARGWLP